MTKEESTKIVNFMTTGAGVLVLWCGHISHILKMHNFFLKCSYLLPGIDQRSYVCRNNDHGRIYQNDSQGRAGSCARVWPYKSYSEDALFL